MPRIKPLHLKVMAILNMPTHGPYRFGPHYQINLIYPRWYRLFWIHCRPLQREKFFQAGRRMVMMRADLRERRERVK